MLIILILQILFLEMELYLAYEVNISELYIFKFCDVVFRIAFVCLHLKSLKS